MNANDIPRRRQKTSKGRGVELSQIYMFGTEQMKWDMSEEELAEYIEDEGVRTLPDMSVAMDPVMTIDQCRAMFRTGRYPEGLGEELGFDMQGE